MVVVLEDGVDEPGVFISSIYRFLGVDPTFRAPSLRRRINVAAIPRSVTFGRVMDWASRVLRAIGLGWLIRLLRAKGVIEFARTMNSSDNVVLYDTSIWPTSVLRDLEEDRRQLESLLGRGLSNGRSGELVRRL